MALSRQRLVAELPDAHVRVLAMAAPASLELERL